MKKLFRRARWGCLIAILVVVVGSIGLLWMVQSSPKFVANGADTLRRIFGPRIVARIEQTVFQIQDTITKIKYDLGLAKPASPWQTSQKSITPFIVKPSPHHSSTPKPTATVPEYTVGLTVIPTSRVTATATQYGEPTEPSPTITPSPISTQTQFQTETGTPTPWALANLDATGDLAGEGVWEPYIQNLAGDVIAYRTFIQPDAGRSYALTAIVALDLTKTRLHFVLGSVEPYAPDSPKRSGEMPSSDKTPGVLMAMFNGGFRANNGHYGAMADGVVALPPIDGYGTIAMYKDGSVRIGSWGTDILPSGDFDAWRENGPLIIHQGAINPKIYDNNEMEWGYTIKNVAPTVRSGVGLSADGNTLYYFAGQSLTMEALAKSMVTAGVAEAMQLDINGYWVLFVAVHTDGVTNNLEALLPDLMFENLDRYLHPYPRDFFYVTTKP